MVKEKTLFGSDSEEEDNKEYKPSKKKIESSDDEDFEEVDEKPKKAIKKEQKTAGAEAGEKRKRDEKGVRNADGNQIFELTTKRRVTVRPFLTTGEASVDIREYYQDKSTGEAKPGKSGICFPLAQWKKLMELVPEIEEAIANIPPPAPKRK